MAARKLGAQTATQEEQAKKAEFKPVQAATEPAAPKQADTKQKIKKQAAAAKEVAPASTPVTASPHLPCSVWKLGESRCSPEPNTT